MEAPPLVAELVRRFEENLETHRSAAYNETQVRREFIDPLFGALGWDVENRHGYAEAYKDVIHEDAIKIGGATKAPDYCFRIGGRRMFFVEAKKPAINVREDVDPAYQLRRYAWSAKLSLSILTDFEELAVYDCRVKPGASDKASAARVLLLRYDEYVERWSELANVFSREAVLKGSFDRFAQSTRLKRGTAEVDSAILLEIEGWRELLAKNFASRNAKLEMRELNFAVQRTIDRIIFLRMCEDRGIEIYGQLQSLLGGVACYRRLCELFRLADERYNSGLFHFEPEKGRVEPPDEITTSLALDDKPLKEIIRRLYYPESPYEFSALPAEILGQVYEQFLGKVIRLTPAHRAVVEDKPAVKKAGGVYYTPGYIVDYVVGQTVGKLVAGQSPRQVAKLRVLDPACGSGSFLVRAYQFLLDWHRDWYVNDGAQKHSKELYQALGGQWWLTTGEKKRILLNNIFGVDLDSQAVEVTKLSLLLKVLEGENRESLERQRRFLHQRALPDLGSNVKCGNSLIGPDFFRNGQKTLLEDDEEYRLNAFDWRAEFSHVYRGKGAGFDVVIGNPPWGQKEIAQDERVKQYLLNKYPSTQGIYDLFRPFVEQGILLTKPGGLFGMVLPDIVLLKDYPSTRKLILDELSLEAIDWWGMAFKSAVIDAATIIGWRGQCQPKHRVLATVHDQRSPIQQQIQQQAFQNNPRYTFNLFMTPAKQALLERLAEFPTLGDICEIHEGVHSGNMRQELFVERRLDGTCEPMIFGRDEIVPYLLRWNGKHVRLGELPKRRSKSRYANAGDPAWFHQDKILVRRTGDYVLAAVDREGRYASNNFFVVFPRSGRLLCLDGLVALLNSELMTWVFRALEPRKGRVFAELKIKHLRVFPVPHALADSQGDAVLRTLSLQRAECAQKLSGKSAPHDMLAIERRRTRLDEQINGRVLQLFGLDAHELSGAMNEAVG